MQKFHELADNQDSFTSEYRVVWPDGTTLWLRGHGRVVARTPDGKAHRLVSIVADVTERKAAEDHAQFLMHELSHRSKNLLAVIQSISRRTARTTPTMEEFESRFGQRLQGLAASHDVLVRNSWQGAPLADLMRQQLMPFVDIQSSRVEITGPELSSRRKRPKRSDLRSTNSRQMQSSTARFRCQQARSRYLGRSIVNRSHRANCC